MKIIDRVEATTPLLTKLNIIYTSYIMVENKFICILQKRNFLRTNYLIINI
jgi:hypothetical protein